MSEQFEKNISELLVVAGSFIRLKPRMKVLVPENLSRLKERLRQLHPEGGLKHFIDFDLFYRIGLLLQESQEPLSMGDLGERLNVPLSTATRMVDWLVDGGFVERLPDPGDRRIVRIALSVSGKEVYQNITDNIKLRTEQILCRFTEEEQPILVSLLRKLVEILEEVSK